ncbi:peroxiredoxin family protein [Pedobacter sp. AW31-3R]|uniref:peroxiredoxin family protein n=1 Tax=Pedobacter sp. AW31-3R TaxID=3445781 RepID=UPI003F9FF76D
MGGKPVRFLNNAEKWLEELFTFSAIIYKVRFLSRLSCMCLKDKNFTILGVSLDQPGRKQAWLDAIHKDGLTWTHVSDLKFWDNAVVKQYGIKGVPANFLIDPTGKIIARDLRGEQLQGMLEKVIGGH